MCARIRNRLPDDFSNGEPSETFHYATDGTRLTEEEYSDVVDSAEFDARGEPRTDGYSGRYLWNSERLETDVELQHLPARCYDPTTGRWLNADPLVFDGGGENLYRYPSPEPK